MLYPYQQTCVDYALRHNYTINACEMGLGKSRIALEAVRKSGERLAVFGPTFLQSVWEMESATTGVNHSYFPYSTLHKVNVRELRGFDFWVADEVHYCKNPTAKRTHAFYSLLEAVKPRYFLGLTGTPIKNRIPDFWTLLAFCCANPSRNNGPHLEGDLRKYRAFCRHFCHTHMEKYKHVRFEKYTGIKEERVEEFKSYLQGKYIRFTAEGVLKDLPELTRIDVVIDGVKQDAELAAIFFDYMEGRKVNSTAKAQSALLKTPNTAEYVKSMRENGVESVVIFTDHIEAARRLGADLKAQVITGSTPVTVRQKAVADFQLGVLKTIVATIGSLSVGVTLSRASHVVFNDLSWTPSDNQQAEKRIHRIGQKSACFAHYIHATPTDLHIKKTLTEKINTIMRVL